MKSKQVILVRTDIRLPEGKDIAQIAHGVTAFLTRRIQVDRAVSSLGDDRPTRYITKPMELSEAEVEWIRGIFTKVTLAVNSEEELLEIKRKADEAGLESHVIKDAGLTVYKGVPTITCMAFAPMESEKVDAITGHLKLYKGSKRPFRIGVMGGIGSGKSMVCRTIGVHYAAPVFYSDIEAQRKMTNNDALKDAIVLEFGRDVIDPDGSINRSKLGAIVFANKDKLQMLNKLVHPLVHRQFENWSEFNGDDEFQLVESALMAGSPFADKMDYTINVTASKEVRIKRVMERNGITREQVLQKMENQPSDAECAKRADYTIQNQDFADPEKAMENILSQFTRIITKIRSRGLPQK